MLVISAIWRKIVGFTSKWDSFFRSGDNWANWKIVKIIETNTDNCVLKDYKPNGAFYDKYIEYEINGNKIALIEQYLEKIRSYLGDMIDELKKSGEWKII